MVCDWVGTTLFTKATSAATAPAGAAATWASGCWTDRVSQNSTAMPPMTAPRTSAASTAGLLTRATGGEAGSAGSEASTGALSSPLDSMFGCERLEVVDR